MLWENDITFDLYLKRFRLLACCLVTMVISVSGALGATVNTVETEEPEPRKNELSVTYGYPDFSSESNEAVAFDVLGFEDASLGGVEEFYWTNSEDDTWRVYMDGKWLLRPEDFALNVEITDGWEYFFNLDYRRWREYDYQAGPWYPAQDLFYELAPASLIDEINRLELSFKYVPEEVELKLTYRFYNKEGNHVSTRLGDNYVYLRDRSPSRGIVPTLIAGEETIHTVDASVKKSEGIQRSGARVHYQRRSVEQERITRRAVESKTGQRYTNQSEDSKDDLFTVSAFTRNEWSEHMVGSLGAAFTHLDGDLSGSRIFGASPDAAYDIDFAALQLNDRGYLDLDNSRSIEQWLFNANAVFTPENNFRWMAGIRLEHLSTRAFSSYLDTEDTINWSAGERQDQEALMTSLGRKEAFDISAFIESRYRGWENSQLYSRFDWAFQEGDLEETWNRDLEEPESEPLVTLLDRVTDFERSRASWKTGINYYPTPGLKLKLEGYLKYRNNDYDWMTIQLEPRDDSLYPGHIMRQTIFTRDINGRAHWRITSDLKSVTRIDVQENIIDSTPQYSTKITSSERQRIVMNQSFTWTPHSRVFFTASGQVVEDLTQTGAADLEGSFENVVVNLPNDYWQADFLTYLVLTKLIDTQVQYSYIETDQFIDNSPDTVAFGTDLTQHHAQIQFILHLTDWMTGRIGYQYFEAKEPSSANYRDLKLHLVTSGLQWHF